MIINKLIETGKARRPAGLLVEVDFV